MSAIQQMMLANAGRIARSTPAEVSSVALTSGTTGAITVGAASSVVADDLILLFVSSSQPITTPSGYTHIDGSGSAVSNESVMRFITFYKVATGADSSIFVSSPGSGNMMSFKLVVRGADLSLAIKAQARSEINVSSALALTPVGIEKDQMIVGCTFGWNTASFNFGNFSSGGLGSVVTVRASTTLQYTGTLYRSVAPAGGASFYALNSTLSTAATHVAHTVLAIYGLPL